MAQFSVNMLLEHYERQKKDYPWKRDGTPPEVQVLVEGALEDGQTWSVTQRWDYLFRDVRTVADWLKLSEEDKHSRMGGLRSVDSVNWLAAELLRCREQGRWTHELWQRAQAWFPAGMALLRFGAVAYPVNNIVRRVASRIGHPADELIRDLVSSSHDGRYTAPEGILLEELPPSYRVVSSFLDIADRFCRLWVMKCVACPLQDGCARALSTRTTS